jgi:hypothetical protein
MQAVCDAWRCTVEQLRAAPIAQAQGKDIHFGAPACCGHNVNNNKKTC